MVGVRYRRVVYKDDKTMKLFTEIDYPSPNITIEDIENWRAFGEDHRDIPDIISGIPLTMKPGIERRMHDKTNGDETEFYSWVPNNLRQFMDNIPYKSWFWTIVFLKPHQQLPIHVDTRLDVPTHNMTRLHWPIKTNEFCEMIWFEDDRTTIIEKAYLEANKCYAVNVVVPHTVTNNSGKERIHLLCNIDIPYLNFIKDNYEIFNARE